MSVTRVADRVTRQDAELLEGQSLIVAVTTPGKGLDNARINIMQGLTVRQLTQLREVLNDTLTAEIARLESEQAEQGKGAGA